MHHLFVNYPSEAYLELSQKSTMELLCENSFNRELFSQKSSIVYVRLGSKYTSALPLTTGVLLNFGPSPHFAYDLF